MRRKFPRRHRACENLRLPADHREPSERLRLVATRMLARHADGWRGWAYQWNEAGTDAFFLKIAGAKVQISTIAADGSSNTVS
jgi:hypothetical protein